MKCWLAPGEYPRTSAPVMKALAGRWWLSGGRGKSIKKSRRVAELRGQTKINVKELFLFLLLGQKNISAVKL